MLKTQLMALCSMLFPMVDGTDSTLYFVNAQQSYYAYNASFINLSKALFMKEKLQWGF